MQWKQNINREFIFKRYYEISYFPFFIFFEWGIIIPAIYENAYKISGFFSGKETEI